MNMGKVCFVIYCVDERSAWECKFYIERLLVPKGFEIELVYIKDVESIEELQKLAGRKSEAEYKVYIDQNILIVNKFFLYEVLMRFQEYPDIGTIGVWGSSKAEENDLGRILLWSEEGISEVTGTSEKDRDAVYVSEILFVTRGEGRSIILKQDCSWCIYDCRSNKGEGTENEYRYQLLRAEFLRDFESRRRIGNVMIDGRLSLPQQIQRAEMQAFAKTMVGYYWEDHYTGQRKWKKYLEANGTISLKRDANEDMNVVMSFNHGYVKFAQVMLQSLYENNSLVNICVHVLQCDLTAEDRALLRGQAECFGQRIAFYDFDRSFLPRELMITKEWSVEAYFRLFMAEILPPDVERILYLDVDVIVNKPIYDYYYMDMQGYDIVGCRDFSLILKENFEDRRKDLFAIVSEDERFVYINSGVMLVDVTKLREKKYSEVYMRILSERKGELFAPDQDIINLAHWDGIGLVDEYRYDFFNACFRGVSVEEVKQHVSIIHYAGPKPWMPIDIQQHAHRIWWEYADRALK